jgi:RNA polymerase sigma factor (sigma-70 family)
MLTCDTPAVPGLRSSRATRWGPILDFNGVDHNTAASCVFVRGVRRLVSGFEDFARQHGRQLVRFACTVTADASLAEDIVQTVLMRFMVDWDRFAAVQSPEAYARRAIVNEYLSWRRKWARLVPTARVPDRAGFRDLAEDHANRSDLAVRVAVRVAELPARQRTVVRIDLADGIGASERTDHAH